MKINSIWKITGLMVITVAAMVVMFNPWHSTVSAQNSNPRFSYLQVQAGDATRSGGKEVIDMRNGNIWVCIKGTCTRQEHLAFEQITDSK